MSVLASPRRGEACRFTFEAIGTRWEIKTREPLGERLRRHILERTRAFDATYSRFRPDSLVSRIATTPEGGRFDFPEDGVALFDLYDRLHAATGGAVDPLVGRDLELLGYDRAYSLTPAPDRAATLARGRAAWSKDIVRDGASIVTQRPLVIDVGAAGKGCLVDIIAGILREAGHTEFVVDGSGDLRHAGGSAIRVGLAHPLDPRLVIGVAGLKDSALCASAVTGRAWGEGLHHVLDARTGAPVRDVVATWVVAEEAATADGLATALFFTGAERLAGLFRFSSVRMFADGRAEVSPNFAGELFTSDQAGQDARGDAGATAPGRRMKAAVMAGIVGSLVIVGCPTPGRAVERPTYADGTYTATGVYGNLPSSITVTVTLAGDAITAVEVTPHATNPTSLDLQRRFAAAVPKVVVGKPIDKVRVGRLAGSSGTPKGFNAALRRIKEQARSGRAPDASQ